MFNSVKEATGRRQANRAEGQAYFVFATKQIKVSLEPIQVNNDVMKPKAALKLRLSKYGGTFFFVTIKPSNQTINTHLMWVCVIGGNLGGDCHKGNSILSQWCKTCSGGGLMPFCTVSICFQC